MRTRLLSAILLLMLFLSSCNLPTDAPPVPTATEVVAPLPPSANAPLPPPEDIAPPLPSATSPPPPTNIPLPTVTFTPTVPIAWPKDLNVNCRFGYGTEWLAIGALVKGQPATVIGRNSSSTWWRVQLPNTTRCWVAASVTDTAGNLASLPVISQSTASVIKVNIEKPQNISVAGCIGPIPALELKGSIETNGPTTVDWHFDTEQSGALASHTKTFDGFGTKNASDSFGPTLVVGTYWVKLVVTTPNGKVAESGYKIECP